VPTRRAADGVMWVEEGVGTAAFDIPRVCTCGKEASVVMVLASANRSPVSLRFAFFGLGLPFVSCEECTFPQMRKKQNKYQDVRSN
jgi:hypothetical protein